MEIKTILSKAVGVIQIAVGVIQIAIGVATIVFAFLSLYDAFSIQAILGVSSESIGLYLWIFIIFGLLSTVSGLFLVYER